MKVEYIPWICLTTWRSFKKKGYLTVCNSLFTQIIIYNKCRFTRISKKLSNCSSSHWCIKLHWCRICSRSRYNHSISHCSFLFKCRNYLFYGRCFLTTCYVNTEYRFSFIVKFFLVDDGINSYSSLTSLSITNDKLTLTSTNRNHCIYSFKTCLHRFRYGLSIDYSWSLSL